MSVMAPTNQVKHYRIRKTDHGEFYISYKKRFQSMVELVDWYRTQADGLWLVQYNIYIIYRGPEHHFF